MINNNIIEQIYQPNGRQIKFDGNLRVYNLGCGKQHYPGVIGVDWDEAKTIDIKHNLDVCPWPIPDNSADVILAFHFIEHTSNLLDIFKEMWRISKNGSRIIIEVPHFRSSSAYKDPTHKNFFTCKTINYFCKNNHTYTNLPIKLKLIDLSIGWPAVKCFFLKRWFKNWLKKHQDLYDNRLYMLFPVKILVFELEVVK